jgi:hypothetical protein
MRTRRGNVAFSGKTLLSFVIILSGVSYIYLPMYWDYWAMRTIVKDAAQEWRRSKKLEWSEGMMLRDMKRKDVSTDVGDRACQFIESRNSLRVECAWTGTRFIPLVDKTIKHDFSLTLTTESEGAIEIY